MRLALLALLTLPLASCVTSEDFQRITDQLAQVEAVAASSESTSEDLSAALAAMGSEVEAVSADVEARSSDFLDTLNSQGGVVGIASSVLLYLLRDATRKRALTAVKKEVDGGKAVTA